MSTRVHRIMGKHGNKAAQLLVSHNYDYNRVTLCTPTCDYIDIQFDDYRHLLASLVGWIPAKDGHPDLGETVLILTTSGTMQILTRHQDGDYGHVKADQVVAWALLPPPPPTDSKLV